MRTDHTIQTTRAHRRGPFADTPRWAIAWLITLIIAATATRLVNPTPWIGSDDASYHAAAEHVLQGKTITRVHHHYGRLSVVLAVAGSMAVFGNNVTAVVLPTIVFSILTVVLVVAIGYMIWDWWVGLCAGSVVAFLPYFRVLSTTAYPDVHACFWATLAAFCVIHALRAQRRTAALMIATAAGVALGLAVSAKIFTIWALVGLVALVHGAERPSPARRRATLAGLCVGGVFLFIAHGLAYSYLAGDFWYKWHAITAAQGQAGLFPASGDPFAVGPVRFFLQRMGFFLGPATSGWGWLALTFWPAALYVAATDRRGRPFALWAMAAYLLVAFFPVSFSHGIRPYPSFVGRNILFVCVPFALCLGAAAHQLLVDRLGHVRIRVGWPLLFAVVFMVSFAVPHDLSSFRDRPTSRIGMAITKLIDDGVFDHDAEIHMTPSMYWRFRVLFPPELRERLRVSTSDTSPNWWRDTTTDIVSRRALGVPSGNAVLLATPGQLSGEPERWDYGVGLEPAALSSWRYAPELGVVNCGSMTPTLQTDADQTGRGPWLVLRGAIPHPVERKAERPHDADMG